jgi:hypothetical protein
MDVLTDLLRAKDMLNEGNGCVEGEDNQIIGGD